MEEADVPVSIDYQVAANAQFWSQTAHLSRPWRAEMLAMFARILEADSAGRSVRVLELGSGPGLLAEQVLQRCHGDHVALDFSAAMHDLARERLGALAHGVTFIERSLRDPDWGADLGVFDFVITNQAVHELRHKRHAPPLHRQVRRMLAPSGVYLVSDHWLREGGMTNDRMYMTVSEQAQVLRLAGFAHVEQVAIQGDLVLHRACD